ncbi:hypothetical protein Taro_037122 [Colocasia esculenta]|uniref:Uncharacterized protein n=1 Tax=Colocasia esculenta TaxID=4460 RepID=A0A843W4V2_COLES|nr:hypothetical protein [Colocasia esculenta]
MSVGMKGALEPRNARRYSTGALSNSSGALSNSVGGLSSSKPTGLSSTKMNVSLRTGVQRKLEMDFQEAEKNEKSRKTLLKQPPCRPPARNRSGKNERSGYVGPGYSGRTSRRVSDAADKLAEMTLSPPTGRRRSTTTTTTARQPPPAMKAGGWHTQSAFLVQSNEIPSARSFTRKLVG